MKGQILSINKLGSGNYLICICNNVKEHTYRRVIVANVHGLEDLYHTTHPYKSEEVLESYGWKTV